jgi:hypothetical protein
MIPSVGGEAYAFNQIGDEVLLRRRGVRLKSVAVQLSSWACQSGAWFSGDCATTPGATFRTPITPTLYRASSTDPNTGETTLGATIATVTKTFGARAAARHGRPGGLAERRPPPVCVRFVPGDFNLDSAGGCCAGDIPAVQFNATG